jgi:hypothetical protein
LPDFTDRRWCTKEESLLGRFGGYAFVTAFFGRPPFCPFSLEALAFLSDLTDPMPRKGRSRCILVSMQETGTSFKARWAAVNTIQDEELRRLSADERFDQLLQLFELRTFVREDPKAIRELSAVRSRWATLGRVYESRP